MIRFLLLTLLAITATAESFEVASITPCAPGTPTPAWEHAGQAQFVQPGGHFAAQCPTLKFLFEWAYDLQPALHGRGPEWFETKRYDILAKADAATTEAAMKRMTQTLLTERFHLKFHTEKKELPVYILSTGKTSPKLTPSSPTDTESIQMTRLGSPDAKSRAYRVTLTRFSIARLADTFSRQMDRPILDQTGLTGEFNFTLELTPDESQPNTMDAASMLIPALRDLGFTLRADKAAIDYYVIDSADRSAVSN
jgi:uncharacterized protein (TIGR03435 family)